MVDINPNYFEHTRFQNETFRFRSFPIINSDTFPHWHNHLEMVLSTRNVNDVHANGLLQVLRCGDVLVIPPGSLHSIRVQDSDYTAVVIGDILLTGLMQDSHLATLIQAFMSVQAFSPLHINAEKCARIGVEPLLKQLLEEEAMHRPGYEAVIKADLCLLFGLLMREYPELATWKERSHEGATQHMKTALVYLAAHYREKVSLADMGRLTNMSVPHFCRLFKAHTGKTFMSYLTLLRLEHAYQLLTETALPITGIPERTGFCNGNYFSRIFRARYGITPSAARKSHVQAAYNLHTQATHNLHT